MKLKPLFLTTAMLLSMACAFAQDCDYSGTAGQLTWCIKDSTLTISGEGEMVMPHFGWPWRLYVEYFTNVVIESGVTTVASHTFRDYHNITSVDMPSVTTIGFFAFDGCSSLVSVDMTSVITIGMDAFSVCSSLVSVDIPNATTIGFGAFGGCSSLILVDMPNVTTIEQFAFANCSALVYVDMPNVTTIEGGAFTHCYALASVNIPNVTTLGFSVFRECGSLVSVDMPNVTTIGIDTFNYCFSIVSVDMPNVTTIANGAFSDCYSLVSVDMPSLTTIGESAFADCYALVSANMPSITTIGRGTFSYCISLASVTLSSSLIIVEQEAFLGCTGLEHIYSYSVEPPEAYNNSFEDVPVTTCILHVPAGSKRSYSIADGWKDFTNIVELPAIYAISGQVKYRGAPLAGVTVSCTNGTATTTDAQGEYSITAEEGSTVTITPSLHGYTFLPESRTYSNITANITDQHFVAATIDISEEASEESSVVIYPNPTTGEFFVDMHDHASLHIEIFDLFGRKLTSPNPSKGGESPISFGERAGVRLDISHLPNGVYFLKIDNETIKIVKN